MDLTVILILLLIIMLFTSTGKNLEGFHEKYPRGANEYSNSLPRRVLNKRKVYNRMKRDNHLKSLMWETRLPGLVSHRYSYNDDLHADRPQEQVIPDKARLKELPLHLKNRWSAIIDTITATSDPLYNADMYVNRHMIDKNINYAVTDDVDNSSETAFLARSPIEANPRGQQIRSATLSDYGVRHPHKISAINYDDLLPAQYADRGKKSLEDRLIHS